MENKKNEPRPFLKWAGSKKQLLVPIREKLKYALDKYNYHIMIDAFLGSGAVTFMMINEFGKDIEEIIANDCNKDLMNCFGVVKSNAKALIECLKDLENEFRRTSCAEGFYKNIRETFNNHSIRQSKIRRAAYFIFLNHTCFNGLYRVNSKGEFNVPYGKNQKVKIFNEELLYLDSEAFKCVNFRVGDFEIDVQDSRLPSEGVYYFDPPYRPISKTSYFSQYTKNDFGEQEQLRLAKYSCRLCNEGAGVIVSNSDSDDDFYKENYIGFTIDKVKTVRMLSADTSKRGAINEVLLSRFE
jgi:DNA adenine methylase